MAKLEGRKGPVFTRYLYEFELVKDSLQQSIFEKKREEALFWAYELYHSGFKEEVWEWTCQIYLQYYSICIQPTKLIYSAPLGESSNTYRYALASLKAVLCSSLFGKRIMKLYAEWKDTGDSCLLGTVVGTLAMWDNDKKFIILYKDDRHQTVAITLPPRYYLKQVSKYPIRGRLTAAEEEAYLGINWLYYCAKTPIWETRIREYRGTILEGEVAFNTDDDLEAFYDKWGLEPDEQSTEMHHLHGIDLS